MEKRPKVCRINQWDCRPTTSRKAHPERKENLRNRLLRIEVKIKAADHAVLTAVNDSSKRKATEEKSMLAKYAFYNCSMMNLHLHHQLIADCNETEKSELPEQQLKKHSSSLNCRTLLQQRIMIILTAVISQ